jgi:hypothetical protein
MRSKNGRNPLRYAVGQLAGLISSVKSAQDIVEDIAKDMGARFKELNKRMNEFLETRPGR